MSGAQQGGGAPGAASTTRAPAATGSPAQATPAPATPTPGQAPGQPPPTPPQTGRLSMRDATRTLGERRRAAAGAEAGDAPPGRRAPRTAPAARSAMLAPGATGAERPGGEAAGDADAGRQRGADVLAELMAGMRGQDALGAAPQAAGDAAAPVQPAADAGAVVTLEIGGKPQAFTHAQLLDHVLKGTDYTRKSQQLADFAREVQSAQAAVAELAPILTPILEQQIRALEGNLGEEPNWVELARTDPAQYNIRRAEWDMAARERNKLATLQAHQSQQTEAQQRAKLAEGHKQLVRALPGWEDPAKRGRIQGEIVKWGRENGYPDGELRALYEARYIVTLAKAMMFDRMMAGARTDAPVVPVVQRGSLPAPVTEPVRSAESQFQERPSVRNAAQLLSARRAAQRTNGRGV